jgi:type I restriction enzyme M protein
LHCLAYLDTQGTAVIIEFPGVLYRTGAEQKIRKYLVDNNFIDAIIQLPSNLFFGTPISTCIIVLKKSKKSNDILFIDASKEFEKNTNSNKLTENNISNIISYFSSRKDIEYISKVINNSEVAAKEYNLSVNTYIEQENTKKEIDINVLNEQLEKTVAKIETLRKKINEIVKELN